MGRIKPKMCHCGTVHDSVSTSAKLYHMVSAEWEFRFCGPRINAHRPDGSILLTRKAGAQELTLDDVIGLAWDEFNRPDNA